MKDDNYGWISVADRIPVEEEVVLVATKSKNGSMNIDKGYVLDGRWIHRGTAKVIFWQPLPELPKEGTE